MEEIERASLSCTSSMTGNQKVLPFRLSKLRATRSLSIKRLIKLEINELSQAQNVSDRLDALLSELCLLIRSMLETPQKGLRNLLLFKGVNINDSELYSSKRAIFLQLVCPCFW